MKFEYQCTICNTIIIFYLNIDAAKNEIIISNLNVQYEINSSSIFEQ